LSALPPWAPQQLGVGGGSSRGPALCNYLHGIYAAWKGAGDDERMFWSSFDGTAWSPQQQGVGGGSSTGPALAVFHGLLFEAWKGVTGDDRMFWSSFDGINGISWYDQQVGVGGGSSESPAIAAFRDQLFAVWKGAGDDQGMYWSSFDGTAWSEQKLGPGATSGRPGLAAFGGRLIAAWKGVAGDDRMFWSSFDGTAWSEEQQGVGGGSEVGPQLAVYGVGPFGRDERLFAAWRGVGDDQRMFWSTFDGATWSPQEAGLGGGSDVGPSLAPFAGALYAAWKGVAGDDRMFWSSLEVDQPRQHLAIARHGASDQTDVFTVGSLGTLQVAWVVGGGGWNGPEPIRDPLSATSWNISDPNAPVAPFPVYLPCYSSVAGSPDWYPGAALAILFVVDATGALQIFLPWDDGAPPNFAGWTSIVQTAFGVFVPGGVTATAVANMPPKYALVPRAFGIGPEGALHSTFVSDFTVVGPLNLEGVWLRFGDPRSHEGDASWPGAMRRWLGHTLRV
jgi:hypothetical protein